MFASLSLPPHPPPRPTLLPSLFCAPSLPSPLAPYPHPPPFVYPQLTFWQERTCVVAETGEDNHGSKHHQSTLQL